MLLRYKGEIGTCPTMYYSSTNSCCLLLDYADHTSASCAVGFFDFYIIPLAKKLKECGVFGVYSEDYLSNAQRNRTEWELKGRDIVAEMLLEVQQKYQRQDEKAKPFDPSASIMPATPA